MSGAWNVSYSYSHADAPLRDELGKFLAPLKHQGRIVLLRTSQQGPVTARITSL